MKSLVVLVSLVVLGAFQQQSFAQVRKIPAVVTDAFKYKYRNAESVEWKDKLSHYTVNFQLKGEQYEATFKNDGTWAGSQRTIEKDSLPEEVNEGLEKSKYADWEVETYYQLIYPDDHFEYRLLVRKSDINKRDLTFGQNGRLIKDKLTL
ncbi:PepSY-like domain-containing protein [Flavihumibacter profundi]|uniref:PepSY-like domain-containing protein n=1 Tax=Flavihumibacter profundi TaxID=2716883 RepID=UPI001CC5FDDA|nr:PepSY-like domain-containing protein [Flavihumibacter profundi]MBZ5859227.1 PepSY-like domain-containing protein [Flavihumibacter profundi]